MKNISLILLVFLLVPIMGSAVITSSFSPLSIDVNNMSLISFDPSDPLSQPNLTTLTINTGNKRIDLKVRVNWNSSTLVEANFQHRAAAAPYAPFVTFSNRELISNEGHPDFEIKQGFPEITVSDVLDSKPLFKDAALSGTFPDGDLQIRIWVREYSTAGWTVPDSDLGDAKFTIKIRNAGTISLQTPGVAIGQNPPQISERPVSFIWNSVSTGFDENKSTITIREYPPNNPPNSSSIENTGNLFYTNI
ncbi:MAG: hypothetical protein PHO75_04340, partial [Candidatus Shapirobacteria bacterium]|nr:hypothetical protein [Candidatus Shapirobacteria bacterium]